MIAHTQAYDIDLAAFWMSDNAHITCWYVINKVFSEIGWVSSQQKVWTSREDNQEKQQHNQLWQLIEVEINDLQGHSKGYCVRASWKNK